MAFGLWNRVRENSTTTGTGPFTVTGAVSGYKSFGSRMSVGDTTFGTIVNGTEWVTGLLTYSASNQLTVTTVFESSNADAAVTFSGGTKDIFIDLPAFTALSAPNKALIRAGLGSTTIGDALFIAASAAAARGTIGLDTATLAKSGGYTVVAADYGALIKCTSSFTLAFTAAATLGDMFKVLVRNDGTGVITLDPNSTETIDGATTKNLYPGDSCIVVCDGSNFKTVGKTADSATFSTTGHVTLASGLIIQWGIDATGSSDNNTSFEVAFPTACVSVVAVPIALDGTSTVAYSCHVSGISTSQFSMRKRSITGTAGPAANVGNAYWIAVGY